MHNQKDIIDCYDKTAKNYADRFLNQKFNKSFSPIVVSPSMRTPPKPEFSTNPLKPNPQSPTINRGDFDGGN